MKIQIRVLKFGFFKFRVLHFSLQLLLGIWEKKIMRFKEYKW